MFKRILIANRGEIAVRIIQACQELGIETVAVYSHADVDAVHVKLADYAYHIGHEDPIQSYLNHEVIIAAALETHADAIHPGYGFLSEDAVFAEKVNRAGLSFIGPQPEVIRAAGNKDYTRQIMKKAGIPLIKGSNPLTVEAEACKIAKELGYPVMIKPVSGGGGKGMAVAYDEAALINNIQKNRNASFAAPSFYLEKYLLHARHIEVQIVADTFGDVVQLGERECSLQRRNQKILEEAPSCALTPIMRQTVGELAIRIAKAIHYTSVGTIEFLMDDKGSFYFMEINPRIQVEHGITDLVTGIDLVKTQIKIAAGLALNINQEDIIIRGHAIECRINAEDPFLKFMPSPGQISFYHQPGGPNVRVDSGVCSGSMVPPYYDSLIAKILVHGRTRGEAIQTMKRALAEFRIEGIKTTVRFQQYILKDAGFCNGDYDTQYVNNLLVPQIQQSAILNGPWTMINSNLALGI